MDAAATTRTSVATSATSALASKRFARASRASAVWPVNTAAKQAARRPSRRPGRLEASSTLDDCCKRVAWRRGQRLLSVPFSVVQRVTSLRPLRASWTTDKAFSTKTTRASDVGGRSSSRDWTKVTAWCKTGAATLKASSQRSGGQNKGAVVFVRLALTLAKIFNAESRWASFRAAFSRAPTTRGSKGFQRFLRPAGPKVTSFDIGTQEDDPLKTEARFPSSSLSLSWSSSLTRRPSMKMATRGGSLLSLVSHLRPASVAREPSWAPRPTTRTAVPGVASASATPAPRTTLRTDRDDGSISTKAAKP
mmetsp:Transcript_28693/g.92371  ORF Transcript_28693/g.92371 Transcript_28693/m.92371 type:complete len:307 (+) Transcript_28693:446-1366(+)